jgi:hypothetical protein
MEIDLTESKPSATQAVSPTGIVYNPEQINRHFAVLAGRINFNARPTGQTTDGRKDKMLDSDPECPRRIGSHIWDYVKFRFSKRIVDFLVDVPKPHTAANRLYYIETGLVITNTAAKTQEGRWNVDDDGSIHIRN